MAEPAASVARPSPLESVAAIGGLMLTRLDTLAELSRRYPDGVSLHLPRRRLILISSPAAVRRVLVDNAGNYHKGLGQAEARVVLGDGLLTAEGATWHDQRSAVAGPLRARTVQQLAPAYLRLAHDSVTSLIADGPCDLDMTRYAAQYTVNCLAHTLGFRPPPAGILIDAFDEVQRRAMFDSTTQGLITPWVRPSAQLRLIRARAVLGTVAQSIASAFPGTPPAWASRDGIVSLLLAGYETTASVLSWATAYLARRPVLQDELACEAATLPASGKIGIGDVARLRHSAAVFRETVRLRPPVWLISRRAEDDDVVDGHRVRRGDDVVLCPHGIQRGRAMRMADDFVPDRRDEAQPRVAFGMGPRSCPGASLADLEATLWLSLLCRETRFSLAPGLVPRPHARLSQSIKGGLPMHVERRAG